MVTPARAGAAPDTVTRRGYTAADVRFMQGMIGHHAQALVLTALIPERTQRSDFHLMGERITLSQETEIAQMSGACSVLHQLRRKLQALGEERPELLGHQGLSPDFALDSEIEGLQPFQSQV